MSDYRTYPPPRSNGAEEPPEDPGPAQRFIDMARRIQANHPDEFSGAVVIVPPPSDEETGTPVEILIIDPHHDEAHFWHVVKAKVEIEEGKFAQLRNTPAPGRYR